MTSTRTLVPLRDPVLSYELETICTFVEKKIHVRGMGTYRHAEVSGRSLRQGGRLSVITHFRSSSTPFIRRQPAQGQQIMRASCTCKLTSLTLEISSARLATCPESSRLTTVCLPAYNHRLSQSARWPQSS